MAFPSGGSGGESISLPFWFVEATMFPRLWLLLPSSKAAMAAGQVSLALHHSDLILPPSSTFKDSVITLVTCIIQDNVLFFKVLKLAILMSSENFPCIR